MSKRIVCVLLALIMLVGLLPAGVVTASAASNRSVSENAVKFIKDCEGYSKNAYWDNSQYSYGYGTVAPNGLATISETDADKALREELKEIDKKVNNFAASHGKNFTQSQHDALVSFTYNVGWGWMSQTGYRITKAVINGSTGNDFLQAITLWSNVDSIPQVGLVSRRMAEANMYLNGQYSKTPPKNYTYVKFDANSGVLGEDKVQAYNYNNPVSITSVPTREGYTFLGWYDSTKEDASWVGTLNSDTAGKTLYARWQKEDGSAVEAGKVVGTAANYTISGTQLASTKVYSVPNANTTPVGTVKASDKFKVTAEYMDSNNVKWVKIESGWLKLGDIKNPVVYSPSVTSVPVTVTNAYINIRKEPNTKATNAPIGTVNQGDKLIITEVKEVKGALWGKFERGWIALMYTDYSAVSADTGNSTTEAVIATGTVFVTNTNLNVRTGAGTDNALVGSLSNGAKVDIYEITSVGGHNWGRIGAGRWVCLDYVNYQNVAVETPSAPTVIVGEPYKFKATVNVDGLNIYDKAVTTGGNPIGSLNKNANVSILEVLSVDSVLFGKIISNDIVGWIQLGYTTYTASGVVDTLGGGDLNVRVGAGSGYAIAKDEDSKDVQLSNGTKVTILELKGNGTGLWGRVKEGWVSMDHIKLNTTTPTVSTTPTPDASTGNTVIMTGVVNSGINLNVRLGAGVNFDVCNSLVNGTEVKIYEKTVVNGHYWGKLGNNAWICLTYVTDTTGITGLPDSSTGNSGNSTTTTPVADPVMATVVNCTTGVNIRSTPGTNGALVGSAPVNSRVKVYEQTTVNGALWARTEEGWVSMLYLKLDTDPDYSNPGSTITVNGLFFATVLVNELPVYDSLKDTGTAVATMVKGNSAYVAEIQSPDGTRLCGKVTVDGKTGWIDLGDTTFTAKGTVTTKNGGRLNVRESANASAAVVEELENGRAIVLEKLKPVVTGSETKIWGMIAEGKWVSLEHITLASTTVVAPSTGNVGNTATSLGKIINAPTVNVRSAAGVKNPLVTTMANGTQVTIHEETAVDGAIWCRISTTTVNGWVAKDYIEVIFTSSNGNSTGSNTNTNVGTGTETTTPGTSNYSTGIVNSNIPLNVRQLPDVNSAKVAELPKGMTITIYEQKYNGGMTWGRVDNGWVSLSFVTMTSTGSTGNGNMGTIIKAFSKVNVRSAPGTGNAIVGEVMVGSRVEVLGQQMYNGAVWYQISNGWVAGEYVELDAPFNPGTPSTGTNTGNATGSDMTNTDTGDQDEVGGKSTTATLNHRNNDVVKFYNDDCITENGKFETNGTIVVITALKGKGSEVWANTKYGWFNLSDEGTGFLAIGTVNTVLGGDLNVRAEAGRTGGDPVAKLDNKSSITLTNVVVANGHLWGKMAKGWVSLEHLALTATYGGVGSATPGTANLEKAINVYNPISIATIKSQHLSINVYDKVDGAAVATIEPGTSPSIQIKEVIAGGTGMWAKILCENTVTGVKSDRYIKLSDVDYAIHTSTAIKTNATTSAGGTAVLTELAAGTSVKITNLVSVSGTIYGQIIDGAAKDGWVSTKDLSLWYVAPATVETLAPSGSGVIFKATMKWDATLREQISTSSAAKGTAKGGETALVTAVHKDGANKLWAEVCVLVTAPDMSVTTVTRYMLLENLGAYTAVANATTNVSIRSAKNEGDNRIETCAQGGAVTVTNIEIGDDGQMWAKIDYKDADGNAVNAYIKLSYLSFKSYNY